ncbi:hypothetical protein EZ449_09375 [Pedobacter frigidisoli]|uniref:Uncharacterized protein n=1 Tax=Pedobacter frigidisoli TaxID=2530455 RepID=A0A4R0P1B4_9SPHI|nr:hypothetical protein [Pedobacter frigidisoli]TCD10545.1 hypothetical protein EZ449_09375 [Pedobacter frigidisoli]
MSTKGKKIFLAITIILPMIIYCYIYYKPIIQNAPFRKADFVSMQFSYGLKDTLENSYNSATGAYQYVNSKDSVLRKKVFLKSDDILYLHRKANEIGLWNFPDTIGKKSDKSKAVPRYDMTFNYKEKSKHVVVYGDFDGNPKLLDAAMQMRKIIQETLIQVEKRSGK